MSQPSGSKLGLALAMPLRFGYVLALFVCVASARANIFSVISAATRPPAPAELPVASTSSISREVKEVFEKSGKAVVKIRGIDEHGELSGTGFFIDPAGTIYTAFSVGGDTESLTVEFDGKTYPARLMMADLRSDIALLKADIATPALPI